MAESTGISYAKSTVNFWIGCTENGPGCDHCYAKRQDARGIYGDGSTHWGPGVPRYRTGEQNWNNLGRWNKRAPESEFAGRKGYWPVFINTQSDFFDNEVPEDWRALGWQRIRDASNLTIILVTKRVGNVKRMLPPDWGDGYRNVVLIATVVNQKEADRDIPKLLALKQKYPNLRVGLSMGPLLGPVDLTRIDLDGHSEIYPLTGTTGCEGEDGAPSMDWPRLDWVIVEGESGPGARPMHPGWVRAIVAACVAAGVAVHFKQWGEWGTAAFNVSTGQPVFRQFTSYEHWVNKAQTWVQGGICLDASGRELKIGADFMRARDEGTFPVTIMHKVGVEAAGRLLDGKLYDAPVPELEVAHA